MTDLKQEKVKEATIGHLPENKPWGKMVLLTSLVLFLPVFLYFLSDILNLGLFKTKIVPIMVAVSLVLPTVVYFLAGRITVRRHSFLRGVLILVLLIHVAVSSLVGLGILILSGMRGDNCGQVHLLGQTVQRWAEVSTILLYTVSLLLVFFVGIKRIFRTISPWVYFSVASLPFFAFIGWWIAASVWKCAVV